MVTVAARLPLRGRAYGPAEGTRRNVVGALDGVPETEPVVIARVPIDAGGREEVVERGGGEAPPDGASRGVARSDQHGAVLVAVFERSEPPCFVPDDGPAECEGVLLPVERRLLAAAVEGRREPLKPAV